MARSKHTTYSPSSPFVEPIQAVVDKVLAYHFDGTKIKKSGCLSAHIFVGFAGLRTVELAQTIYYSGAYIEVQEASTELVAIALRRKINAGSAYGRSCRKMCSVFSRQQPFR